MHYHFTGQEMLNLQHIEETLLKEFEELYYTFSKLCPNKTAFVNVKCVILSTEKSTSILILNNEKSVKFR